MRQSFTLMYAAEIDFGKMKLDEGSKGATWVLLSSVMVLPLADSQRQRLRDVIYYHKAENYSEME